jgi:hypothetical protein
MAMQEDNNMNLENSEISSLLTKELQEFLLELASKLNLDEKNKAILIAEFNNFAKDLASTLADNLDIQEEEDDDDFDNNEAIKERIINQWGDKLKSNKLYAQRALKWLNIQSIKDLAKIDLFKLINKMVDLGKMLAEDNNLILNLEDGLTSKEEARQLRKKLMIDKDFFNVITNKNHANYKDAKNKLDNLNRIISGDNDL